MTSNIDPDLDENIREIKKLQGEQQKFEAELDEYLTSAHQAIVDRDFDKVIELLLKGKQVYIDLNETVEELRKTKDDIGYHD